MLAIMLSLAVMAASKAVTFQPFSMSLSDLSDDHHFNAKIDAFFTSLVTDGMLEVEIPEFSNFRKVVLSAAARCAESSNTAAHTFFDDGTKRRQLTQLLPLLTLINL
jgi:hypothetical protein